MICIVSGSGDLIHSEVDTVYSERERERKSLVGALVGAMSEQARERKDLVADHLCY